VRKSESKKAAAVSAVATALTAAKNESGFKPESSCQVVTVLQSVQSEKPSPGVMSRRCLSCDATPCVAILGKGGYGGVWQE
jgi:hypothetical protein